MNKGTLIHCQHCNQLRDHFSHEVWTSGSMTRVDYFCLTCGYQNWKCDLSPDAQRDLDLLRAELKKESPNPERVSALLCGEKYNVIDLLENV